MIINKIEKLYEISDALSKLISKEEHLNIMEILFFDALNILRENQHHPEMSLLLQELQRVQKNEYKQVQDTHVSVNKRVAAIKKFKNSFRKVVRKAVRLVRSYQLLAISLNRENEKARRGSKIFSLC